MYLVVMLVSCLVVPRCCALDFNGTETDSAEKTSSLYAQGGKRNVKDQGSCQVDEDCLSRDQQCMPVGFLPHPRVCKCPGMFPIYNNGTCQIDLNSRLGQPCNSADDCWMLTDDLHCNGTGLRNATGTCVCEHGLDEDLGVCKTKPFSDFPPIDLPPPVDFPSVDFFPQHQPCNSTDDCRKLSDHRHCNGAGLQNAMGKCVCDDGFDEVLGQCIFNYLPLIDLPPVNIPSEYVPPPSYNSGSGGFRLVHGFWAFPFIGLSTGLYCFRRLRRRRNGQGNVRTASRTSLLGAMEACPTSQTPGASVVDLAADVSPPSYDEVTKSSFRQENQSHRHLSSLAPSAGQETLHVVVQKNTGLPSAPPLLVPERYLNSERATNHQTFPG